MKCNAINSNLNFAGKYRLDANQTMPNQDACLKRDYMLGVACGYAYNGDEVSKNLADFYKGAYNKDKYAPCNVVFNIPDDKNALFEESMSKIGQKFDKLS